MQAGFRYLRPGSRAFSLPVYLTHLRQSLSSVAANRVAIPEPEVETPKVENAKILDICNDSAAGKVHNTSRVSEKQSANRTQAEPAKDINRAPQAEMEQAFEDEDGADLDYFAEEDEEVDGKLSCIQFDEEKEENKRPEPSSQLNGRMTTKNGVSEKVNSLQESKEGLLRNRQTMKDFVQFLAGTQGETLVNFWIDCEQFRDDMVQFEELETREIQSKIYLHAFRELLDKYGLKLTNETRNQLINDRSDTFSPGIFSKAQYDALKRLRCYWVPRFVIYCQTKDGSLGVQKIPNFNTSGPDVSVGSGVKSSETLSTYDFLPSLNVARTLSVQPEVSWSDAGNPMVPWIQVLESGKRPDTRVKSGHHNSRLQTASAYNFVSEIDGSESGTGGVVSLVMGEEVIALDEITMCIVKDKDSGGPFQRYLQQMCLSADYVEVTLTSLG